MTRICLEGEYIIKAPRDRVYEIIRDFENVPENSPLVAEAARVASRDGNHLIVGVLAWKSRCFSAARLRGFAWRPPSAQRRKELRHGSDIGRVLFPIEGHQFHFLESDDYEIEPEKEEKRHHMSVAARKGAIFAARVRRGSGCVMSHGVECAGAGSGAGVRAGRGWQPGRERWRQDEGVDTVQPPRGPGRCRESGKRSSGRADG